ncbi:dihydrofolate reductase-like domain-containing protein [Biscogniauxia marginata]|nr:dihydrofolate reductase-like domain-containing protein [Biscogniauxia marginata]
MASPPAPLTEDEKAFFLANGYLKLTNCFTRAQAASVTEGMWTRLGMSPTDKRTWTRARTHMPSHRAFDGAAFAPKAWAAICELCGGEDRVDPASRLWRDSLIVNLGAPPSSPPSPPTEEEGKEDAAAQRQKERRDPRDLDGWHVDGDFFVHYLDSPEQALLVIPLFSDVEPDGGGATMLCPGAIPRVARWLRDNPAGVSPRMVPRSRGADFAWGERDAAAAAADGSWYRDAVGGCADDEFVEACGRAGDVFLLHPLMVHSATANPRRLVRVITNPPVSLREPHRFDRDDDGDYSLVERKTMLAAGGREGLRGWRITAPRERLVPQRVRIQEEMKRAEVRRLEEQRKSSSSVSSQMLPLELTLVVAATRNMGIGRGGKLPWTGLRKEMAYFARVTKRLPPPPEPDVSPDPLRMNVVIMGRKTWDSIPVQFRPLKGRLNIVISRSHTKAPPPREEVMPELDPVRVRSMDQAITYLTTTGAAAAGAPQTGKVFVIGGAQIYRAALRHREASRILLTRVMTDFQCDTYFPLELSGRWVKRPKEELDKWVGETVPEGLQVENGVEYEFQMWERAD